MSVAIKNLVISIIKTGDSLQAQCLQLTALAKAMTYVAYRNEVATVIGEFYGVEPHESRKGKLLTFKKDTAAEQKLSKLIKLHPNWVNAGGNAKREQKTFTKAQKTAAVAFCSEFEGDTLNEQVKAAIAALKALL